MSAPRRSTSPDVGSANTRSAGPGQRVVFCHWPSSLVTRRLMGTLRVERRLLGVSNSPRTWLRRTLTRWAVQSTSCQRNAISSPCRKPVIDHNHPARPFDRWVGEVDLGRTGLPGGGCHAPIRSRQRSRVVADDTTDVRSGQAMADRQTTGQSVTSPGPNPTNRTASTAKTLPASDGRSTGPSDRNSTRSPQAGRKARLGASS
jgi:hypothetical protein